MYYHIRVKFGEDDLPVSNSNLRELTIVQDINKFLPEFKLTLQDTTGALTHIFPFDQGMSKIYIEIAKTPVNEDINSFSFAVYRRKPGNDVSNPFGIYDVEGLLDMSGLFGPDYCRGLSGNIKTNLENIAKNELGITNTDVSTGLSYSKNLLQPKWSNIQFLKYLKENLIGSNNECGFRSFIKRYNRQTYFVFKSLTEMVASPVAYKFILADKPYEDRLPVFSYYIFDNYKLYESFGSKKQAYSYFNYDTTTYTEGTEDVQSYQSLSDFFLIDKNDSESSNAITNTGRSNDFTSNFAGMVKGSYYNRLASLVKMWISTEGLPNVVPGQTVEVFFPHGLQASELYSYQYSGFWLVEQVVHNLGEAFYTKLLLTRHGMDTDKATSLLSATKRKTS
jgi:hypothetical protein